MSATILAPLIPGLNTLRNNSTPSVRCAHSGGAPAAASTDGNDSTPATTEIYLCETEVRGNGLVTGIATFNGSVAAGNILVALFDGNGVFLMGSVATAMAGTDTYQRVPFTDQLGVTPGTYFTGVMFSSTSARFNTWPVGNFGAGKITGQTASTLPSSVLAPSTFTANFGPMAGLY